MTYRITGEIKTIINIVVFYYLNASEIWPDKRGGL
jgi:hypothetical protein